MSRRFLLNLGARLALILGGIFMPLLIFEIGVRLTGLAPPPVPNPNIWESHPELGWWHIPNSGGTFYSSYNEYSTDVQINSLGLRDDPDLRDYQFPEDPFTFLILADSFGESLQVPLETTFFKQLETRLEADGRAAQSINSGVGSWGTDQQSTYFRLEGHRFQPDLTLLFFFARNDTLNSYGPLEIARNGGSVQKSFYTLDDNGQLLYPDPFDPAAAPEQNPPREPLPPAPLLGLADQLWQYSDLYRFLVPYLRDNPTVLMAVGPSGILGGEGRIRAAHPATPLPFFVYQTPMNPDWEAAWQLTDALLLDLKTQVEAEGSRFAVIIIPAREQVTPAEWTRLQNSLPELQEGGWDLTHPNQMLERILEAHNILYLDLLPVFREASTTENPPLYFVHDGHWTAAGHSLAAEALYEFVQRHNLADEN